MKFLDNLLKKLGQPATFEKKKLFQMGKVLGSGTYGEVREGQIKATGQKVAIKVVVKDKNLGSEELVKREMEIVSSLDHPNVIKLLDWFESKDSFYLVFELATGGELFERIVSKGRFTEQDAQMHIKTILEAVAYLHEHKVVHRDLKPENLLFREDTPESPLLIVDFGISKTLNNTEDIMTTICGSFGYTAPEVLQRRGYGKEIDLWSIGVITYTILCGYTPFPMDNANRYLVAARNSSFEFHAKYWSSISDEAKSFIRTMLSVNSTQRGTAADALHHPWIVGKHDNDHDLLDNVREGFSARKTFQRGIQAVVAANRLRRLTLDGKPGEENVQEKSETVAP